MRQMTSVANARNPGRFDGWEVRMYTEPQTNQMNSVREQVPEVWKLMQMNGTSLQIVPKIPK